MRDELMGSERRRQAAEMAKESRRALNPGGARRARRATFTEAPDTKGHSNVHGPGEADTEESTARHTGKITVFQTGFWTVRKTHQAPYNRETELRRPQNSSEQGSVLPRSGPAVAHPQANKRRPNLTAWLPPRQPFSQKTLKDDFRRLRTARMPFAARARLTWMRAVRKRDSLYPVRATARWKTCLGPDPATRHTGQTVNAART